MHLTDWKRRLDSFLDGREAEMLLLLERLVNQDSFTTDGADVNRVGRILAEWLTRHGFSVCKAQRPTPPVDEPWQGSLAPARIARSHASREPGIGFIGHMDTVFPAGTAAARPFRLDRDRARGPGVADMKAGLVANVFAAHALKELGLNYPLTLVFTPDEELGSPTGSLALEQSLKGARAVINSEPGGPGGMVTRSRKGSGHMLLTVHGKAVKAAEYRDGASANLELAHKILQVNQLLDLERGLTVNAGQVLGGQAAATVPPRAEARIHLTYRQMEDGHRTVEAIREVAARTVVPGTRSELSGGLRLYPLERNAGNDALFQMAVEAGVILGLNITGHHYESAAESGFCSSMLRVPTICNMGPEGDNIHSEDEYLLVSTLVPRCKLIALTAVQAAFCL